MLLWAGGLQRPSLLQAEAPVSAFFPLAVGNRWVYESSEGSETAPVVEAWEVTRQEGNAFVLEIEQSYLSTGEGVEEFFVLTNEGISRSVHGTQNGTTGGAEPSFFLKAPLTAGASWQNEDGRYAITAVDETVTVPAGTFTHCVEVTRWSTNGKVTVITLYAPGVGMVQREESFPVIGGIGGFDAPQRSRTVLRLKEWTLTRPDAGEQNPRS